ncbi:glucose/sorbosone dehydrogenase [Xenococcus sp. PCC 7305]|uniref:DUF4347 domain-containing protein n=1 Tax=Xenococcus sp. PCC 7305 TaxID=102125 RepID=UPI0002ACC5BF|nr:DUF4347 domain-containing protein [Xenococcus sp. PCC 7305]ELS04466.1 glucose/sorbosone dehydrogenase [Xenococcus sp. PCC 7305]
MIENIENSGDYTISQSSNLTIIDSNLDNYQDLAQGVNNSEILILNNSRDGITQITDYLANQSNIENIHIFSHGNQAQLQLGDSIFGTDDLAQYTQEIQSWNTALTEDADILIYACNLASASDGLAFVEQFGQITGADIAASDDLTGSYKGDWDLEITQGTIEAQSILDPLVASQYSETLEIAIAESGTVRINDRWRTINLQNTYEDPVVILGPPSYNGPNPATVRVDNVTNNSFQARIDEWEYLDETHIGESVGYLVVEAGTHVLEDGTVIIAENQPQVDHTWQTIEFDTSFATTPIVLAQTITENEASAVTERIRNVSTSEFRLRVQEETDVRPIYREELGIADSTNYFHADEMVSWLAIQPGAGNLGDSAFISGTFEADHNGQTESLSGLTSELPVFLASTNTIAGGDPVALRYTDLSQSEVSLFLEEEQSLDEEIIHAFETVGYLALDPGLINTAEETETNLDEPIALWTFDQAPINNITLDNSNNGSNHSGVLVNGVTSGSIGGDLGGIVTFDGQDDYIEVGDSSDLNLEIQAQRTVSVWFNVDNKTLFLPNADTERKQVIYEEGGPLRGHNIYIENGSLYVGSWDQGRSNWDGTYLSTDAFESNTWHHVALVLDAAPDTNSLQSGVFSAYLDGVKFGEGDGLRLLKHPNDMALGAVNDGTQFHDGIIEGTGIEAFGGSLADVAIYNKALSGAEIAEKTGLVAQWNFEETSGLEAGDSSPTGNNNIGSLINGAAFATTETALGGTVRFDTPNGYVAVADTEDINGLPHAKRTISTWFKADDLVAGSKQVIYEEGGVGRGLNIYLDNNSLYVGGWSGGLWSEGTYLSSTGIQADTWHHVALVLDADESLTSLQSGAFSAYLDGVQFAEGDGTRLWRHVGGIGLGAVNVDTRFHDGTVRGTAIEGLTGNIADTDIFNRVLSGAEIQALYNSKLSLRTEELVTGLAQPEAIDWIPNTQTMLIPEKGGVVKVFQDGALLETPFIDISSQVNNDKFTTRGITDLAVHPDFEANPYVYFFFAYDPPEVYDDENIDHPRGGPDQSGIRAARVIRVTADASTNYTTALPNSEVVIVGKNSTWDNYDGRRSPFGLNNEQSRNNPSGILEDGTNIQDFIAVESNFHNTGSLEFGPDGALYVSIGDGTFATLDTGAFRSQNLDNLSGKILRIDPITGEGLDDNPFFDGDANSNRSKVYQYGLRNPFRIAIHPETGQVYNGETGWNTWEEVNTGGAGANFGWPYYEGARGGNEPTEQFEDLPQSQEFYANPSPVTAPIFALDHDNDGARSVVLGDFYFGDRYPEEYQGDLFVVDSTTGIIRNLSFDNQGNVTAADIFTQDARVVSQVVMGEDGYLYYVNLAQGVVGRWIF